MREAAEMSGHRRYLYNPLVAALFARLSATAALLRSAAQPPLPPTVAVCAAGGDGTLHRLLQAYAVLRCAYPQLCKSALVKFYLVPIGRRNSLAAFLAQARPIATSPRARPDLALSSP